MFWSLRRRVLAELRQDISHQVPRHCRRRGGQRRVLPATPFLISSKTLPNDLPQALRRLVLRRDSVLRVCRRVRAIPHGRHRCAREWQYCVMALVGCRRHASVFSPGGIQTVVARPDDSAPAPPQTWMRRFPRRRAADCPSGCVMPVRACFFPARRSPAPPWRGRAPVYRRSGPARLPPVKYSTATRT